MAWLDAIVRRKLSLSYPFAIILYLPLQCSAGLPEFWSLFFEMFKTLFAYFIRCKVKFWLGLRVKISLGYCIKGVNVLVKLKEVKSFCFLMVCSVWLLLSKGLHEADMIKQPKVLFSWESLIKEIVVAGLALFSLIELFLEFLYLWFFLMSGKMQRVKIRVQI